MLSRYESAHYERLGLPWDNIHGTAAVQLNVHFAIRTANSRRRFESNSLQRSHIHKMSG